MVKEIIRKNSKELGGDAALSSLESYSPSVQAYKVIRSKLKTRLTSVLIRLGLF